MKDWLPLLANILGEKIGLAIDARRRSAIEFRLTPVIEAAGLRSLDALAQKLAEGRDPALLDKTIDAMVTCETLFFRDRTPFEALRTHVLPNLHQARKEQRALRLWSAACATGQEPYSLAMVLDESPLDFVGWRLNLIATDISEAALAVAISGRYTQFEVQRGLPTPKLLRYFQREGDHWRINDHLRAKVEFRRVNLLSDFRRNGRFDIIFCRNVLMYMSVERRITILTNIAQQLAPDGYLVLGAAETVVGLTNEFAPLPGFSGLFTRKEKQPTPLRLVVNA